MKRPETPTEEDMIAVLREAIDGAAARIARERERVSANDWRACFNTQLAILEANLELSTTIAQLGDAAYRRARKNLDGLTERVRGLTAEPTEDDKNRLIDKLDILRK